MPYTHYPKLVWNLLFAWRWPAPKVEKAFLNQPKFSDFNLMKEPLANGQQVEFHHDAGNFTRFMGSIACDQPLEVTLAFSNDECTDDGAYVTDDNLKDLHYDAIESVKPYDPKRTKETGKFFTIIYGRWLRVTVKNVGDKPIEWMRVYVRGSVF